MRRRPHDAVDVVILAALDTDEPQRCIAGDVIGMRCPGVGGQRRNFRAQPLEVETHRERLALALAEDGFIDLSEENDSVIRQAFAAMVEAYISSMIGPPDDA